ncbi:MAG: peroxidase [Candidatus Eremiobacteraeota bacterium]|nr:peroxidase [Candidatus Eremiobacteraeota bacterium]
MHSQATTKTIALACGALGLSCLLFGCGGSDLANAAAALDGSTAAAATETIAARGQQPPPPPGPGPGPGPGTGPGAFEARQIDGTANHNGDLGSAGTQLLRRVAAAYTDGISSPAGANRPSAREVSNAVVAQTGEMADPSGRTAFVWAWGQFVDHDIDLTPEGGVEDFPIAIPTGDPYFDPTGSGTVVMSLSRSVYDAATGLAAGNPRQQLNQITAFLDGSQVYGSDQERALALRTLSDGMLATSAGDLPPFNTVGLPNASAGDPSSFFLCGDIRANENIALTSLHTLFLREHNRKAAEIKAANPGLSDEEIYQRARKHVGALIQVITYQEFLPALLGDHPLPDYRGYQPNVNPQIANTFSTAAYRLGHSQVGTTVLRLGPDGNPISQGNLAIKDAFFQPQLLVNEGGIDPLLKGLAATTQQPTDAMVVDDLRNFLFGPPGSGGLDLASLNMQRGRDHGLGSYNQVRAAYGRPPARNFNEITSDAALQAKLASVYSNVNQVDAWVGLLSEDHAPGAAVGPTLKTILVDQFTRMRDGDRFFYRNDPALRDQLQELEATHLADVIARNTTVRGLQANVFRGGRAQTGPRPAPRVDRRGGMPRVCF